MVERIEDLATEDDFIPDYQIGSDIEDPPSPPKIQGATNTKKKGKTCPICLSTHKRHVVKDHLPCYGTPETCCLPCKTTFGQQYFLKRHN